MRVPIGAIFLIVGVLVLLMEAGLFGEPVRENIVVGVVAGGAFAAVGAMILLGVFTGVGDLGERPRAMRLVTRLALDALGYAFGLGFVAMLAFIGIRVDWGDAGVLPRIVFCGFALLLGGALLYTLGRAVVRAVRGLPYDDGSTPRD
ncbi:MAG: hypothetical protein ABUS48_03915 [Pseudomonadota bacterium]